MTTLILVRHGPSAHVHSDGAVDRAGVELWRTRYDAAGIVAAAQPPESLVRLASQAQHCFASDLTRASESAVRLIGDRPVEVSPLLREYPLPIPAWPTRLPLAAWGALIFLRWQLHRIGDAAFDPTERSRVAEAVRLVTSRVTDGTTGIVVTHAVFRMLMARELAQMGWRESARQGGYGHWSAWIFHHSVQHRSP